MVVQVPAFREEHLTLGAPEFVALAVKERLRVSCTQVVHLDESGEARRSKVQLGPIDVAGRVYRVAVTDSRKYIVVRLGGKAERR